MAFLQAKKELSDLTLNPGIQRKKPASPCKCLLWSGIICIGLIFTICTIALFMIVYYIILGALRPIHSPQSWIYQNTTLEEVSNHSSVVRPLVDEEQTFDIVASVWVRSAPFTGMNEIISESLLFSDFVFRGVSLKDRGLLTNVNFQVPTSIFKESRVLTNFDLRGSFVLIPSSPSLLDHVVHVASWIPDSILMPPAHPTNSLPDYSGKNTLLDHALDGYGIHVPLIEFHPISSRCVESSLAGPAGTESNKDDKNANSMLQDREVAMGNAENNTTSESGQNSTRNLKLFTSNMRLKTLEGHPYIATRSHLRVADFTHIMNFERFNKTFHEFRQKSCGQQTSGTVPNWSLCPENDLFERSLWKTALLQLDIPGERGNGEAGWAYAPYLSAVRYASGPEDLVPLPINRENCNQTMNESSLAMNDENTVNVTWSISFSGRTPAKMLVGDILGEYPSSKNATNLSGPVSQQFAAQFVHAVYGHRHSENAHPRRAFTLIFLRDIVGGELLIILSMLYWYTRSSTAGISTIGVAFTIMSDLFACIHGTRSIHYNNKTSGPLVYSMLMIMSIGPFKVVQNFLRLKVILRLQVQRRGFFPIIKTAPASHTERASARVDAKLWRLRLSALVLLTLAYLFSWNQVVSVESQSSETENPDGLLQNVVFLAIGPTDLTGFISQLTLNYQRKTFTSMYRVRAIIMAIMALVVHLLHSTFFVGDFVMYRNLILTDYISTLLIMVNLYQALRYQSPDEKDDED